MAQDLNGYNVGPTKNIVKVNVLRANVKQTKVIDTDIVFVLEDGRTVFIRDGAVQSLLDNGFSVEFSDGDQVTGQELLQSAGSAEISSVALTGPQASSNDGVIVAQAPQAAGTSPVAQPSSGGGLRTWLAVGTPLVGGVLGGVLSGGGGSTAAPTTDTGTPTNVKPATPVINVISDNDQVNKADKDNGVEIRGSSEASASVTVIWGTVSKTATADASGIWSVTYTTSEVPADALGTTVSATIKSTAGVSSDPASRTVQIDTKLPDAPVIAIVAGDNVVGPSEKTNGIEVSGTAEANSSVEVTWGTVTKIAQADRVGSWKAQFLAGEVPPTGSSNVSAKATDAFGNVSNAASTSVVISPAVTITGQISAGPLQAGHGLTVDLYLGNGTLLASGIRPGSDGVFTASGLPVGVGDVVIARVNDTTGTGDYLDEATGLLKDLNAVLMSTKAISGVNETLNITPITTIAAIKAGLASDGSGTIANAAAATNANAATASAFGLGGIDITTTRAITTESASYNPANGLDNGEKIGAILAALSGADKANGGDAQATINALSQLVSATGATGTLLPQGQVLLMRGAAEAENIVPGNLQNLISDVVAAASSPRLMINAIATDNIITANETSALTISGTVATGASTVSVALGSLTVAAVVSGTNWTYQASADDISALGMDGPKQVQATATFADNSSATASRLISLKATPPTLPLFTRIAGDAENFAVNTTEKADGFAVAGTGDPSSTILVSLGSVTKSRLIESNGSWSVAFERLEIPTADGSYDVIARAQDAFGNVTAPVTRKLLIDTVSPTLLTFNPVTGDNRIGPNDTSAVRFEGTAELGAVVRVLFNGKTYTGVATSTNPSALTGTWSISLPASEIPADSVYEAVATVFDAAGNQGVSTRQNVTVDISPPAKPTVDIVAGDDSVNKAERDNPNGIIISGRAEAGTLVELSWGGKSYTPVRATSRGTYSFQLTAANSDIPIDGSYPISVVAVDSSGNRSEIGTRPGPVIVDTVTLPVLITAVSLDDKINLADKNGSFTVEGVAENSSFVTVKIGGMTETTSASVLDGKWSVTFTPTSTTKNYLSGFPLDSKNVVVTAQSSDLAGNASQQTTRVVEVDTVAPNQPTIALVSGDDAINAVEGSSSVEIRGRAEPGSNVTIDWGTRVVGQARPVDSNGDWNLIVSSSNIPDEGAADIIVRATDAAGNVSIPSEPRRVIIDKSTSVATIDAVGGTDNIINNAERSDTAGVAITGRAETNGRVEVRIGAQTVNADVDGEGVWRAVFLTGQLPGDGVHTVFVRSFDKVGNEAPLVAQRGFTVDIASTTPEFTGTITPAGVVRPADDIINVAERDAGITVRGRGEIGGTAFVTIDALTLNGPVLADGSWAISFTKDQLPATLAGNISVYVRDAAGNISATINKPLTIDTSAPAKPTFNDVAVDNVINRAERDNLNGVDVTGRAEAGARVFVRWGPGGVLKEANADTNGVWSTNFLGTEMNASGATNIIAYQVDAAGNIGEEEFRSVTVATGAPSAPAIDTTILGGDYTVNIAEYGSMTISGTGVAGNKVLLSWGSISNQEADVTANGTWSYTISGSAVTNLLDTTTSLSVRQVDPEGNISVAATTPQPIIFDRTAPLAAAITSQSGSGENDNRTINITEKNGGLVLSGTASLDAKLVRISWTANSLLKSFDVAVTNGSWTYPVVNADLPLSTIDNVAFSVRPIDVAGNVGNASNFNYNFDLTAPDAPSLITFGSSDNVVSILEADVNSPSIPILVGGALNADHGATKVVVTWTFGGNSYSQEVSVLASATSWSLPWNKANLPSIDGSYIANAYSVDAAGNASALVPINFSVNRGIPDVPTFSSIGLGGDFVINISENDAPTLAVRGAGATAGATVFLTLGTSPTTVGSGTVLADGSWTINLAKADYPTADTNFSVYQVLPNTNRSASASQSVILDLSPPIAPGIPAPIGTNFTNDAFINASERPNGLTLSGTAIGAKQVLLTWTTGSTNYEKFVDVTSGEWSGTIAAGELPSGAINTNLLISARAIDTAGNRSTGIAQQSYTFDTTAPTGVTSVTFAGDNIVNLAESALPSLNFTGNLAANHGARKIIIVWNGRTETLDLADQTTAVAGWTLPWFQTYLPSSASSTAQVFTEDAAGNRTQVDRVVTNNRTPAAQLTNVVVAGDGKINLAESTATNITVTGGGASAGSTVFVTLGGVTGQTSTIAGNGTWTVNVATTGMSFASNSLALSVIQRNTQGNESTPVTQTIGVDTAPPAVLVLNDVTALDSINAAEAGQTITLAGTTDTGISSVAVSWGGGASKNAVVTTTGGTATWSVSFTTAERSALVDGMPVRITVTATDDFGNPKTIFRDIPVDTSPPTSLILNDVAGTDNRVNASETNAGITISGQADANAAITVTWGGRTQTTTASGGTWSVFYGPDRASPFGVPNDGANVALSVTQTDSFGNTQTLSRNIQIDTFAPAAPTLLGVSNDYGTPLDGITSQNGNILVGRGVAGEFVEIAVNGSNAPVRVTVNSRGIWTYAAPELNTAAMASTVTLAGRAVDGVGNTSGTLTSFTSVQRAVQSVTPIEVATLTALPANNVTTQTTGVIIRGANIQDRTGRAVSAGDINNDGYIDLIVGGGSPDNYDWVTGTTSGTDFGEAYVVYGRADWSLQTTPIDLRATGSDGYAIRGEAASDQLGSNVAFLGDVNNDNRGDIAVYAANGDNPVSGLNDTGALYVFFSPASTPGVLQTNAGLGANRYTYSASSMDKAAGFVFRGLVAADRPGIGIVGAKLNGDDNISDIVIGINGYDRPASTGLAVANVGAVAVIFGRSDNNYTSVAATARQNLDINSLVAPGSLTTGQAGAEGFLIRGTSVGSGDSFGQVIGSGDFNKDGLADLIIGAPLFDKGGNTNDGAAYVIYGKATKSAWDAILTDDPSRPNAGGGSGFGKVLDVTNLQQADGFRIVGETQNAGQFGTSVRSAGDMNGDGIDDMIIGALSYDVAGVVNAGSAYVIFGKAGTRANLDVTNLTASDGFIIRGAIASDAAGATAVGAGDVNGDGYADLLVTVPGFDRTVSGTTTNDWGLTYLILGRAQDSGYGSLVAGRSILNLADFGPGDGVIYIGRSAAAALGGTGAQGYMATPAGDLNKDGFADFVIGSQEASPTGRGSAGESYIIFGSAGLGGLSHIGTPQADNLLGGTFNDTISGLGGADNILTFDGNDTITVPNLGFNFLDGGAGIDTLHLTGSGDILNVRSTGATSALVTGQLAGIERIDLTGAGNNTLQIDADGLLQLSSDLFAGGNGAERLIVTGDAGDIVNATGFGASSGTQTLNGITYNIYNGTGTGGLAAQLWVQTTVTVELPPPPVAQQMWAHQAVLAA